MSAERVVEGPLTAEELRSALTSVVIALSVVATPRARLSARPGSVRLLAVGRLLPGTTPRSTEPLRVASPAGCGDG